MPRQRPSVSSSSLVQQQQKTSKTSKGVSKPKATATVVSKTKKDGEAAGTSVTVNIEYPPHFKGRKFYKSKVSKKKDGGDDTTTATEGDEAHKSSKHHHTSASKRAKIAHYQKRDASVVSWYSVRNSINQHLKYRLQKYPVPGLREMMTDINALACTISGASTPVVYGGLDVKSTKENAPQFQISETAVDMLTFYVGKKAERRLGRAAVFAAARNVQTVAVEDLIMAEDSLYGTLS